MEPIWLIQARELQAIAQTGLAFAKTRRDRRLYAALRSLAARVLAEHIGNGFEGIESAFARQRGYATPLVAVRAASFLKGRLLLVRDAEESTRWELPGGWADPEEGPSDSVKKRLGEGWDCQVNVRKLAGVYDQSRHSGGGFRPFQVYIFVFMCDVLGCSTEIGRRGARISFFDVDGLPPLSQKWLPERRVRGMFEHARNPTMPTEFD
jgi:ADP-ribose pyrophosphatase YjhB (NUDIX family)